MLHSAITPGADDKIFATVKTSPIGMKIEVVVLAVSDVDRAKRFYKQLGWRLDADFIKGDIFRVVQFTPPGSPISIHFGKGVTTAQPGSQQKLYLVVSDIEATRQDLISRGADVGQIFHRLSVGGPMVRGVDPGRRSYNSFATFEDPDGNEWLLQEVTSRLPGRVEGDAATFGSSIELAAALRRAAKAHGEHERRVGQSDDDWPNWYAEYVVQEQTGRQLPL